MKKIVALLSVLGLLLSFTATEKVGTPVVSLVDLPGGPGL